MSYTDLLRAQFNNQVDFRVKRPGILQLIAPLYHEDGDMIDIFLEEPGNGGGTVRVCDHAMTLMRLSYSYEVDTPHKQKVLRALLAENRVGEDNGNLFIDASPEELHAAVLQFAQVVAKVSSMGYFKREIIRGLFYEQLAQFVEEELRRYNPGKGILPLPERDDLEVDFQFDIKPRPIYLFGARDTAKVRLATISCLEFQRHKLPFKSFVVHEDFETLPRKDQSRVTSAADKQFISLDDFRQNAIQVLEREAA